MCYRWGRELKLGKNRVKSPRIKNGVDRLVLIFFRDTNSHSVTDIKTEIGISVVLAIVDAVVVEED